MPTTPRNAKLLLKKGEANVIKRTPFTIQLTRATGETTQPITLGVDCGSSTIGLSSTTEKKELFNSEVQLRNNLVRLMSERSSFRRNRRNRKTWYRPARFLNRGKQGWLPPSVRHRIYSHVKLIRNITKIFPVSRCILELASFDIQKIKNPDISGKEYQQGEQLGFYNVKQYVLHRDGHKCLHCKGKSGDKKLNVHHIVSRKTGSNSPENLATLCKTCHNAYHEGKIELKVKIPKSFKHETFMTILRSRLIELVREFIPETEETFGYITKFNRERIGLEKSHDNDAFVIAGGSAQTRCSKLSGKFVRKQNRKMFKGSRSHIRNTAEKFIQGFQRFDKVLFN